MLSNLTYESFVQKINNELMITFKKYFKLMRMHKSRFFYKIYL